MKNKDGMQYIDATEIIKQVEINKENRMESKKLSYFKDEAKGVHAVSTNVEKSITNIARTELIGQEVISSSRIQKSNIREIQHDDKLVENPEGHDEHN